ncbi:MAG TPA: 2OG-Fe(II) oxygenase [Gammaproteobacteria bacterium]|nr:2OG-Fe(II) oxygenase [Gammaproteobacteria bacterium]
MTQKYDIEKQATLLFEEGDIPLTEQQWDQLADLLARSEYQHIIGGDADESHSVWVSRYFNDVDSPEALSALSKDIEAIVMSTKMRDFYQQFTGTSKLCLRRCQANRLGQGDYIGIHKDQDSSPDYLATIVFHFSDEYQGGYFQTDGRAPEESQRYRPAAHMALVNNCSVPHQVTRVEGGERLTLACFLSLSFAPNRTSPRAFKIGEGRAS